MWPALGKVSDFGGLLLLVYFLARAVAFLWGRVTSQHRRDSSELDGHRQSVTDRAKRGDRILEAEIERLRAENAALRADLAAAAARYDALQERRVAEVRELVSAGSLGEAASFAERALEAVYALQRSARDREATLASELSRRVVAALRPPIEAQPVHDAPRLPSGREGTSSQ